MVLLLLLSSTSYFACVDLSQILLLQHTLAAEVASAFRPLPLDMSTIDEQKKQVKTLCRNYKSVKWLPISQMQQQSSRDPPARGPVWISRTSFPAPKDYGLRDVLYLICERLSIPGQTFPPASDLPLKDVGVEFTGWRPGVDDKALEPDLSEVEKLHALENECESKMTILYIHGGGL